MSLPALLPALCCLLALTAPLAAASIGQLDLSEVEPLLRERVLARPANQELKTRVEAAEAREAKMHAEMMRRMEQGQDIDHAALAGDPAIAQADMRDREALDDLVRGELLLIIDQALGKSYDLVLDASYGGEVILTQAPIEDLTQPVQQFLLKQKAAANQGAAPAQPEM